MYSDQLHICASGRERSIIGIHQATQLQIGVYSNLAIQNPVTTPLHHVARKLIYQRERHDLRDP